MVDDATRYPRRSLMAVLREDRVDDAVAALAAAGFGPPATIRMTDDDASALRAALEHPTLRMRLDAVFDGEVLDEARRYTEGRPGEVVRNVRAAPREAAQPAVEVLEAHGARPINWYGDWSHELVT